MTRTLRICSRTIRINHFSSRTIEGGTPTQLVEYFIKYYLSCEQEYASVRYAECTSYAFTRCYGVYLVIELPNRQGSIGYCLLCGNAFHGIPYDAYKRDADDIKEMGAICTNMKTVYFC